MRGGGVKCILLSNRSQSRRVIYRMIPPVWQSGKGRTMETVNRSVVGVGRRKRWTGRAQRVRRAVNLCSLILWRWTHIIWAPWVAQTVKNPPAVQETWVLSLGREDSLKKGMATASSTFAWRIPWTEKPGGLQSMGSQTVGHDWGINTHTHTHTRHYTFVQIHRMYTTKNEP